MVPGKLIRLFESLNTKERKRCREFLQSPYFNKHTQTFELYEFLLKLNGSETRNADMLYRLAFHHLYGNVRFELQKLKDVMSYLHKLIQQFLEIEHFRKQKNTRSLFLLHEFRQRELETHFNKTLNVTQHKLEERRVKDENYFFTNYLLETEADLQFMQHSKRTTHESLQKKVDSLDAFYLAAKLKNTAEMLNRQNIVKASFQMPLVEELINFLQQKNSELMQWPPIAIYYQVILMLKEPDNEDHYHALIDLSENKATLFTQNEAREIYEYAKNHCIKQINNGQTHFVAELFKVYKLLLQDGIIFQDEELTQWDYKNIVTVATRLGEFDWAKDFIHDFKERLPQAERENAFAYNLAAYFFSQRKYDDALELLRDVEFTDIAYNIGSKTTLLKIYYELNETEPLMSLIDSFQLYLKRNKLISEYQYTVNYNLLRHVKRATRIKSRLLWASKERTSSDIKNLKKSIEEEGRITNIEWLLEKIEELAR